MSAPGVVATTASPTTGEIPLVTVAVVGALAGFLAGVFGVGGGILIVPALVLAAGMPQRLAHGTSLAATVPIALASVITYAAHGNIDWKVSGCLAVGAVTGAVVGTRLLHVLPHRTLGVLFAAVLVLSAIRLFIAVDADGRNALTLVTVIALVVTGLVTGIIAGLLGVGGGIIMVPAMILLFGIPPVIAKGTSAAVIVPTAVMGTWRNRSKRNVALRAAAVVGLSGVVTAALGGIIADHMSADLSNVLFATLLTLVALRLLWQLYRERPAS